jgi:hypothetical protein
MAILEPGAYQTATAIPRGKKLGVSGGASIPAWPDEWPTEALPDPVVEARLTKVEQELASLRQEIEDRPKVYSGQLVDLGDRRYALNCPLLAIIEIYGDEVVASIPEFDLYAAGISDAVALANLKAEIVSTYERLLELGEDNLGPMPRRWLEAMKKVIGKSDA